jgi:hypothetical protein
LLGWFLAGLGRWTLLLLLRRRMCRRGRRSWPLLRRRLRLPLWLRLRLHLPGLRRWRLYLPLLRRRLHLLLRLRRRLDAPLLWRWRAVGRWLWSA